MGWKLNSIALIFCLFAGMINADHRPDIPGHAESGQSAPNSTILDFADPGEQMAFEKTSLQGKKADVNALRKRAGNLHFKEKKVGKTEQPEPDFPAPEMPDFFLPLMDVVYGMVVITLIGVLAYLLLKTGRRNTKIEKEELAGPAEWREAMNMTAGAIENELQNALAAREYRLAIRFLYLKNLKQLNERELVFPSPEKTNLQYRAELENAGLAGLFGSNTLIYETVWYGEAMPDSRQYQQYAPLFHELSDKTIR